MRLPDNPRARACEAHLHRLLLDAPEGSSMRAVLEQVVHFPFGRYPDTTAPWHLLMHDPAHMRWEHVHDLIEIMNGLRQPTGSNMGQPLTMAPFQVAIVLAFMGPEEPETGLRVVREGVLTLSRKNGKTCTIAALITALMCLSPDNHGFAGQEIQVGASDRDQAGITFQMVSRMIELDKTFGIAEKFRMTPSKKTAQHKTTLTQLRCLSSDAHRHHGGNAAIVLLDEMGNVGAGQAEEFFSVLTTGDGAQAEPLTFLFSTQAPTDSHFFSQMVDRAKAVNDGRIEPGSFAGFVFEVPEVDADEEPIDPFDEDAWYLGNPGLGTITSVRSIRDWAKKAQEMPSLQNKFELLKLNRRVSETSAFVSRVVWEQNNGGEVDAAALYGRPCWLGLDLSETTDLTALVALFEPPSNALMVDPQPGERMAVLPWYWIPGEDLAGRSKRDHVPYDQWSREGLIDTQSAKTVDYGRIADRIIQCMQDYEVQGLGFDRYRIKYLRAALKERGYEWDDDSGFLVPIGQGFVDQSRSLQVLEDLMLNSQLQHGGHPILKWNASNAVVVRDPSFNRKVEKSKSYGRVDGLVALAIAAHARADSILIEGSTVFEVAGAIG